MFEAILSGHVTVKNDVIKCNMADDKLLKQRGTDFV